MSGLLLLVINPGSTSTKAAIYSDATPVETSTIRHSAEQIAQFPDIADQYDFRRASILDWVREKGFELKAFNAIVARGGTLKPIPGGVYAIDDDLVADAKSGRFGKHVCNVGCQIAYDLGRELGIPALTVDPPMVDELCDEARICGLASINRRSAFHALNQRAIARKLATDLGKSVETMNAIVVHLGGGISVGAHAKGRIIDVNNALDGDGPFSPERAGTVPAGDLVGLCFSGKHTQQEIRKMLSGRGGLVAHLASTDGMEIEARIAAGDAKATLVVDAMAFNIAKSIGAAATVLCGDVDAIALTGGLAHWSRLVDLIRARVAFIAPVKLFPGEDEIGALASGALRVLKGEETARSYA